MMMTKSTLIAEPGKHEVTLIRDLDAPRELVFRAFTDPALVARWWGLKNSKTVVDKMEARKGGVWRYVQHDSDGNQWAFNGVYHSVTSPEQLVFTFEFEGMPGHVLMETVTLEDHDGKTRVIDSSVFQSVADRDGMIQSGMEYGANESWDQLEELLKTM
jgi:uncharacterized protein YndB with AHSA1/START domain